MKRIVIGVALAATSIFLVGCGSTDSVGGDTGDLPVDPVQNFQKFEVGGNDGATKVYRINNGGVDCIVADSYESIAISCDWDDTVGPVAP